MRNNINKYIAVFVFLIGIMPISVFAAPGIPHQFYGTVKSAVGSDVTTGSVIIKIGTTQVASAPINNGKYGYNPNLLLVTDPNGNRTGSTLKFFIGSIDLVQTSTFVNGGLNGLPTELNLILPSDTVGGDSSNVSLGSATVGEAKMPNGATNVVLTNMTVLNLSSGLVGREVTLKSGIEGQPVVLTNSNLSNVSASIPDGTKIQGPIGWDGKITPPVAGTSSGTAPAGFSVGSTVISVGSASGTLVFDKPVTLLLANITGNVGYKPSESDTWVQITSICSGNYGSPNAPTYPGECAISNGTDTKIVTYHFTSFGSLTANSNGGGGGGGINITPTKKGDANGDSKVDKYDFALLMSNWGL